jgi:tetratricopeptide (TPR) repeat protein
MGGAPSNIPKCDRLLIQAAEAQKSGRADLAEKLARECLEIDSSYLPGKLLLGSLHARAGRSEPAALLFAEVLASDSSSYEALMSLATLYREGRRLDEAVALNRRALELRPGDPSALNALGRSYLAARMLEEAAKCFERAVALNSRFAPGYYNLAKTRQLQGMDGEAAGYYRQAVTLSPNLEHLLAYGQTLLSLCDYLGAAECGEHCLRLAPSSAAAHLLMCGSLTELRRFEQAETHLQQALQLDKGSQEALQLAARMRPLGHIEEANQCLRRAIAQNPDHVAAYDALFQNQKSTEQDRPLVEQMESLLRREGLAPTETAALQYGLGKGLEDLGEYERSFSHYDEANRITRLLKVGIGPFDRSSYAERMSQLTSRFAEFRAEKPGPSELPIIVIGMMRSGTTLVEQILSSHPQVGGAGEQLFWSHHWAEANERNAGDLGARYVAELTSISRGTERVVDKMPGNYLYAGLIHAALPNARIVHVRRSPIDTCLSIWTTPSHMPHDGGHDKAGIVFVYREYLKAVDRWRKALPESRFFELDYEALVADPESSTRRLVEFCGLDWNELCLNPEHNRRIVNTPSAWQVRQPVYRSSVDRWKRFAPWLGEFRELLELRVS